MELLSPRKLAIASITQVSPEFSGPVTVVDSDLALAQARFTDAAELIQRLRLGDSPTFSMGVIHTIATGGL